MKVLPKILNIKFSRLKALDETYTIINFNDNKEIAISYKETPKSDFNILSDLLECNAYATALLYLNENYILSDKYGYILKEHKVEDYYSDCNDLLNENIEIVEEAGIPLIDIDGYQIFEGAGYILRGNGKKKIKESFNTLNEELDQDLKDAMREFMEDAYNGVLSKYGFGLRQPYISDAWLNSIYTNVRKNSLVVPDKIKSQMQDYYKELYDEYNSKDDKPLEEDGTQTSDIASKVDQDMNKEVTTSKKKHYDILLSGLDEGLEILNKGFLKNSKGQYQRGNYILVKEGDKYLAIHKDKLKESEEIPELPHPYYMTKHNGKYYIKSAHPYDNTDYSFAKSYNDNIDYGWYIYDYDGKYKQVDTADGWQEALKIMQSIDSKKKSSIARD